jgi:hypothetical protein
MEPTVAGMLIGLFLVVTLVVGIIWIGRIAEDIGDDGENPWRFKG